MNNQQHKSNSPFYEIVNEIVIFADLERNVTNNIINFFLKHNLKGKHIHLIVHNYKLNMQSEKAYLNLLKQFKQNNIVINNIDTVPDFANLSDLENIDPWLDIYKLIKKT
ncbi:MAG: hypothetical protein MJ219_00825 [Mycoplasmoidaceae bacterium]|nr:hypothetical protein [Mycoplasmoidaceae bacterium]